MVDFFNPAISEETFAAWLDGAMSSEQEVMFLEACSQNEDLQELLDANDQVEEDYENIVETGVVLPPEFEEEFDIPQIEVFSHGEAPYNNQIELYENDELDDKNDEEFSNHEDYEYENNAGLEYDSETSENFDTFEII